ncbi:MAG: poly(3-hydroxybutyrate) depolymerase [Candidatus Omnitrophota bacterium]|jgi:poly(3-hydroxybutyrate) depolymerase
MKKRFACILFAFSALSLGAKDVQSGEYFVTQSWLQETDFKRPYLVNVPKEAHSESRPVLIFLHGNGGNAKGAMRGFMHRNKTLSVTCILVFAQGYKESWNIVSERAQSDDLGFIETIVTTLGTFDNVQKETFTIMGSSNGAALANQIAIETKLPQIKNYVCMVSHLNGYQHDGKHFKAKGADNNYTAIALPMTGKRILNISGDSDDLVPYKGGPSKAIPAKGGRLTFVDAEQSIFLWARHFGYTGEKLIEPTAIKGQLEMFSYLDGDVVHYKAVGSRHNAGGALTEELLLEFLNHDQASR